jgi:phage terminase Nu1 subunit (DNA packaging protein)
MTRRESRLVSAGELAKVLAISRPTLRRMIRRYRKFPIETKGGRGRRYQFDPRKVTTFLEDRRAEESRRLGAGEFTPAQELAKVRAERERRKLDIETGSLIEAADLRQVLGDAVSRLGKFLDGLPASLAPLNLPPDAVRDVRRHLEEGRRAFVHNIVKLWTETPNEPEPDGEIVPFERPGGAS